MTQACRESLIDLLFLSLYPKKENEHVRAQPLIEAERIGLGW